jgi:hypothetical protein
MKDRKGQIDDHFVLYLWPRHDGVTLIRKVCREISAKTKGFKRGLRVISNFFVLFLSFLLTCLAFVHTLSSSKRNTDPEIP